MAIPTECSDKSTQSIRSEERGYGQAPIYPNQNVPKTGGATATKTKMEQQPLFPTTIAVIHQKQQYMTFQDLVSQYPNKSGICIAVCCTKPLHGPEIQESKSLDCMKKCIEDDLGYVFATPNPNSDTQELRTILRSIKSTRFPESYRWILFYFFGHGNEESIRLRDGDVKRSEIIEELKGIHQDDLAKIVWFECCRLVTNVSQSQGTRGCEDTDNFLIINATAFNHRAFYIENDCGILTKYFTEKVTQLNAPLCVVMGEVRKAIHKDCPNYEVQIPGGEKKIHMPNCEDHVIGSINFLAHSTGKCRVHPENVCATQENLQATVSWSFDKEVVDRILEFKVVLSPKKGRGDPIAKTVDKESGHATLQLCPDCEYMPAVTAVYTDNERFKCKGTSLRTPALHKAANIRVAEKHLSPCEAEVSWSFDGNEMNLSRFWIIATSTSPDTEPIRKDVNPCKRQGTLTLNMDTSYRINVVTVYREGMELRSECEEEFKTHRHHFAYYFRLYFNSLRCRCSAAICIVLMLLLMVGVAVLVAAFSKMPKDVTCTTYNILASDYIECGSGSSVYKAVELAQCPKARDKQDFGVLVSWRTKASNLPLYSQQLDPVPDFFVTTFRKYHLLNGWDIYEWKGSVIEGYCCITNYNYYDTQTAHLYLFLNDTYAFEFQNGNQAHHYLWSEPLPLPPNKTSCFKKWGQNAPYTVEHNSYHFFGVDLPAHVVLVSNITVLQVTVNVSDYPSSELKWFSKDNVTSISLSGGNIFNPTEYLLLCGPPIPQRFQKILTDRQVQSDFSTHVCVCKHPNHTIGNIFLSFGIILSLFVVLVVIISMCVCVCNVECCRKCYFKWKSKTTSYEALIN